MFKKLTDREQNSWEARESIYNIWKFNGLEIGAHVEDNLGKVENEDVNTNT